MKNKILQLKNLGRVIAKYPDNRFVSNTLRSKEVKLSIYLWGRDFESKRAECEIDLDKLIKTGKEELGILIVGKTIHALICT